MRFSAFVPVLLGLAALVLSFLCLFARTKPSFLSEYPIVTLNTSQIGGNALSDGGVLDNVSPRLGDIIDNVIPENIQDGVEDAINSAARRLGLRDFYSAHVMSYCEGYFEPGPVPNSTLKASDIDKNVTFCSNRTAFFRFDPRTIIENELNKTTNGRVNISELNWPSQVDDGLRALHAAQRAIFILYCVAIALISVATIVAIVSILLSGRLSAFLNVILATLAFLAIGIASALVTTVVVKGVNVINRYTEQVGISAQRGTGFLALTWAATAAMFICIIWWFVDCCVGRRKSRYGRRSYSEKPQY